MCSMSFNIDLRVLPRCEFKEDGGFRYLYASVVYQRVQGSRVGVLKEFDSHYPEIIKFYGFSHVQLEKYFPRYTQEMKPLGY